MLNYKEQKEYCNVSKFEGYIDKYIAVDCETGKTIATGSLNLVVARLANKGWTMKLTFKEIIFFERFKKGNDYVKKNN
jgi:hypothetical protein